jgi:hypothetical protein
VSRDVAKGWDQAARQGADAMGHMPSLTERTDLKSGRAGWEGAVKGTQKRVAMKLGKAL